MAKIAIKHYIGFLLIVSNMLILGSCSSAKSNYQREYTRVWKEIIKSEAWKKSLLSNSETVLVEDQSTAKVDIEALFDKRFNSLVSRAYVKIISEAKNADSHLKGEYERWNAMQQNPDFKKDRYFRKNYEGIMKKYQAHSRMLEGLKSWNVFSEFGTNDLDFFKTENKKKVREMYRNGSTEDNIINYLIYRLADLYHYGD